MSGIEQQLDRTHYKVIAFSFSTLLDMHKITSGVHLVVYSQAKHTTLTAVITERQLFSSSSHLSLKKLWSDEAQT